MTDIFGFNRQKYKNRRAFSLAELMIATGILGIGMIIVAMAFPVALDQSRQAAELATSKLVYFDAVNKLKTRIKWTELEQYINYDNNAGALESTYRLGDVDSATVRRIYLLSFDRISTDPASGPGSIDFFNPTTVAAMTNINCVYSADDTYGWVAAVQKISNQNYKFWIFVIREPRGMLTDAGTFRAELYNTYHYTAPLTAVAQKTLTFLSTSSFLPSRGEVLLDDTGTLYTVTDVGQAEEGNVKVMLDKEIDTTTARYLTRVTGTGFTRKNPVLSVYQTVISY
jgi:type II secretory pathway pseudopilin PulG